MSTDSPFAKALVVEDVTATRDWLSNLVHAAFPGIGVYHASDLASARAWMRGPIFAPGTLFLVDLGLPDGSGVDLIREARDADATARLVVTTIYDDDEHLLQAMAAGAHSYLLKDRPPEELIDLFHRIGRDDVALSPPMARRMLDHFRGHATFLTAGNPSSQGEPSSLTPREQEVLRLIGRGLTLPEAGQVLTISRQTVASHVKSIYRKLGITSRAEAALEAARRSLA